MRWPSKYQWASTDLANKQKILLTHVHGQQNTTLLLLHLLAAFACLNPDVQSEVYPLCCQPGKLVSGDKMEPMCIIEVCIKDHVMWRWSTSSADHDTCGLLLTTWSKAMALKQFSLLCMFSSFFSSTVMSGIHNGSNVDWMTMPLI